MLALKLEQLNDRDLRLLKHHKKFVLPHAISCYANLEFELIERLFLVSLLILDLSSRRILYGRRVVPENPLCIVLENVIRTCYSLKQLF